MRSPITASWLPALGLCLFGMAGAGAGGLAPLAFTVEQAGPRLHSQVILARADGSQARVVAAGNWRARAPALSPKSDRLAFQATDALGLSRLLVVRLNSEIVRQPPVEVALGSLPQWSRDGKRLLFSRRLRNRHYLFEAAADGSDRDRLLKPLSPGQIGRWSPDGRRLALVADVIVGGEDRWQLQVRPAARGEPETRVNLPADAGQAVSLEWSPQGRELLLTLVRQSRFELWRLRLQGVESPRLQLLRRNAAFGQWTDSSRIVFSAPPSRQSGEARLLAAPLAGKGSQVLWTGGGRLTGIVMGRPPVVQVAKAPPAAPPKPKPKPKPVLKPAPKPKPPAPTAPPPLGPERQIMTKRFLVVSAQDSPKVVQLPLPTTHDFALTLEVLESQPWKARRQGIGFTLHLKDGGLYRGNLIYAKNAWLTLQGRTGEAPLRLLDGKQLPADAPHFDRGFRLRLLRRGKTLSLELAGQTALSQDIGSGDLRAVTLTVENFDPGLAKVRVGRVLLQETVPPPKPLQPRSSR